MRQAQSCAQRSEEPGLSVQSRVAGAARRAARGYARGACSWPSPTAAHEGKSTCIQVPAWPLAVMDACQGAQSIDRAHACMREAWAWGQEQSRAPAARVARVARCQRLRRGGRGQRGKAPRVQLPVARGEEQVGAAGAGRPHRERRGALGQRLRAVRPTAGGSAPPPGAPTRRSSGAPLPSWLASLGPCRFVPVGASQLSATCMSCFGRRVPALRSAPPPAACGSNVFDCAAPCLAAPQAHHTAAMQSQSRFLKCHMGSAGTECQPYFLHKHAMPPRSHTQRSGSEAGIACNPIPGGQQEGSPGAPSAAAGVARISGQGSPKQAPGPQAASPAPARQASSAPAPVCSSAPPPGAATARSTRAPTRTSPALAADRQ